MNGCTFELAAVELFNSSLQVCAILKFNEAFTIPITTSLGVDDINLSLTSEVFEILNCW